MIPLRHIARQPAFLPATAALMVALALLSMLALTPSAHRDSARDTAAPAPAARADIARGAGTLEAVDSLGARGYALTIRRGNERLRLLANGSTRVVVPAGGTGVLAPVTELHPGQRVRYEIAPGQTTTHLARLGRVTVLAPDGTQLPADQGIA